MVERRESGLHGRGSSRSVRRNVRGFEIGSWVRVGSFDRFETRERDVHVHSRETRDADRVRRRSTHPERVRVSFTMRERRGRSTFGGDVGERPRDRDVRGHGDGNDVRQRMRVFERIVRVLERRRARDADVDRDDVGRRDVFRDSRYTIGSDENRGRELDVVRERFVVDSELDFVRVRRGQRYDAGDTGVQIGCGRACGVRWPVRERYGFGDTVVERRDGMVRFVGGDRCVERVCGMDHGWNLGVAYARVRVVVFELERVFRSRERSDVLDLGRGRRVSLDSCRFLGTHLLDGCVDVVSNVGCEDRGRVPGFERVGVVPHVRFGCGAERVRARGMDVRESGMVERDRWDRERVRVDELHDRFFARIVTISDVDS